MLSAVIATLLSLSAHADIFRCTGLYASDTCEVSLLLNRCKHSIKLKWQPLRFPGNPQWAMTHRTYCSVTWTGGGVVEERKFKPEKCEQILKVLSSGFEGFPHVPWQDASCAGTGGPDGILYLTQHYDRPEQLPQFQPSPVKKDVDPRAVLLEDVRACTLGHSGKRRIVRCPVLPPRIHSWLSRTLKVFDVALIIQNPLR